MSEDISKQILLAPDTATLWLAKLALFSEGTSLAQIWFRWLKDTSSTHELID